MCTAANLVNSCRRSTISCSELGKRIQMDAFASALGKEVFEYLTAMNDRPISLGPAKYL